MPTCPVFAGPVTFVDLVLESLDQNIPDKYAGFYETLKSSDDKLFQQMAAKLSKQNNDVIYHNN